MMIKNNITPKLLKLQVIPMDLSPTLAFEYFMLDHPSPCNHHDQYVETTAELKSHAVDYCYQEESLSTNENEIDEDESTLR